MAEAQMRDEHSPDLHVVSQPVTHEHPDAPEPFEPKVADGPKEQSPLSRKISFAPSVDTRTQAEIDTARRELSNHAEEINAASPESFSKHGYPREVLRETDPNIFQRAIAAIKSKLRR